MKDTLLMLTATGVAVAGTLALMAVLHVSSSRAKTSSMVDVAQRLYQNAAPDSFDAKCKGTGAELEVEGERHRCTRSDGASIVRFSGEDVTQVSVYRKGIRKEAIGQLKGKLGKPDSIKTLGALKMHFWFTKDATVTVGFQSSPESRSTMVSFRSPS